MLHCFTAMGNLCTAEQFLGGILQDRFVYTASKGALNQVETLRC